MSRQMSFDFNRDSSIFGGKDAHLFPTINCREFIGKDKKRKLTAIEKVINSARDQVHLAGEGSMITDLKELERYVASCNRNGYHVLDIETTGLDTHRDTLVGVCLYSKGEKPVYVPFNHTDLDLNRLEGQLTEEQVRQALSKLQGKSINQNMKFDQKFMMYKWGFGYSEMYWDTLLASKILNENEFSHGLKDIWAKYVGKTKDKQKFKDLFKNVPFNFIPLDIAKVYGANDGIKTWEVWEFQKQYLRRDHPRKDFRDLGKLFLDLEMPLLRDCVWKMEYNGVLLDKEKANEFAQEYAVVVGETRKVLDSITDRPTIQKQLLATPDTARLCKPYKDNEDLLEINYNSPTQKAILIYDILKFPVVSKKKPRTTGKEALEAWEELELTPLQEEFLQAYKVWTKFHKLLNDFLMKLPNMVCEDTKAIHGLFDQLGTKTGRFSSKEPNLQQIPGKAPHDKIRNIFPAREGCVFVSSDYSQAEPRILTVIGDVKRMRYAYENNMDLYSLMASEIFNKTYEECLEKNPETGEEQPEGKGLRKQVKSVLLGLMYGRMPESIAKQFQKPAQWGRDLYAQFFEQYPEVKQAELQAQHEASTLGYVTTLLGRKRRLPEMMKPKDSYSYARACRQCLNAKIQGGCADLVKLAMLQLSQNKRWNELGVKLLIQIHDELLAECKKEDATEVAKILGDTMKQVAYDLLKLPQKCDVEIATCWAGENLA